MPSSLELVIPGTLIVLTPELRLDPQDRNDRLHPDPDTRVDSSFAGEIRLTLTKPTRIKTLIVDLVGRQEILINGVFHAYETLGRHLKLKVGDEILKEGQHVFAFEFTVPADTAAYERCKHGSTIHKIIATMTPAGMLEQPISAEQKLGIHANPTTVPNEVPSFSGISKSDNKHLGSIGLQLSARHLIVAGYLYISVTIPSVKQAVKIADLRIALLQDWKLQSLVEPDRCQRLPQERFPIWSLKDGSVSAGKDAKSQFSGAILQVDEDWSLDTRFVLPDDKSIRASTLPSSKTGLGVTHKLAVTLSYYIQDQKDDIASFSQLEKMHFEVPAVFSNCYCVLDALQLPQYVKKSEDDSSRFPFIGCDARNECLYG